MGRANASAVRMAAHDSKKPWEKPQMRVLSIKDKFHPESGLTWAQWNAARELLARSAR